MGKKIAIVTIIGLNNYGNRLQNYAMQSVIQKLGFTVETVKQKNIRKRIFKNHVMMFLLPVLKKKKKTKVKRLHSFFQFEKNIHYSKIIHYDEDDKELLNDYDFVIYGSDQIWNTEFKSFSRLFLGCNADKNKNIAVSASFGKDEIDSEYVGLFRQSFSNFKAISVRENSGKLLVEKYSDMECIVTPDPTLAVSKEEWITLEKKVIVPDRYCFTYFLGEIPTIDYIYDFVIHGEVNSAFGPSEFLYLIHHADIVYTDSFHACVFCIIFEIPFRVYKRESKYSSMMDRIDTLLNNLAIHYEDNLNFYSVSLDEIKKKEVKERLLGMKAILEQFLLLNCKGETSNEIENF